MARINVEEKWWTDPRRDKLIRLIGDSDVADGRAIKLWRLAQSYWVKQYALIPDNIFIHFPDFEKLIECGLVQKTEAGFYTRGAKEFLTWNTERRESGRIGGNVSAMRPRDANGRLLSKQTPSKHQANTKLPTPTPTPILSTNEYISVREAAAPPAPMINSFQELKDSMPIIARERLAARFKDQDWVDAQLLECFEFHTSEKHKIPQNHGAWQKKIITWFSIAKPPGDGKPRQRSISEIFAEEGKI